MQKALILALLVGAFLYPEDSSLQEVNPIPIPVCDAGETPLNRIGACGISAAAFMCELANMRPGYPLSNRDYTTIEAYHAAVAGLTQITPPPNCSGVPLGGTRSQIVKTVWTSDFELDCPQEGEPLITNPFITYTKNNDIKIAARSEQGMCSIHDSSSVTYETVQSNSVTYRLIGDPTCPVPHPIGPYLYDDGTVIGYFCYRIPVDEPPPECDDIIGNCGVPDTCFRGGNNQLVCFEDPSEKCDVEFVNDSPVYLNCETGCGFVNDNFICSEEPDIPNLDDCLVTTNGYACIPEIPTPDDNIDDPNKPIDDMVKGDFKNVLIGVETRTDATNKLLANKTAIDSENAQNQLAATARGNRFLERIDTNTKEAAESLGQIGEELAGDGEAAGFGNGAQWRSEITNALGITGDETYEDLVVEEISLEQFKAEFSWSIGTDQCPPDRVISILGANFYMDWGPFCQAFTILGYFIMAAAYILSTMLAFKGR